MSKYFGTDGFRGEANKALTADHAFRIGRFLGHYYAAPTPPSDEGGGFAAGGRDSLPQSRCRVPAPSSAGACRQRPKILIGKDTRRSSYMLEYALAAGITASGGDAYLLHVTTTPSVAYITRTEDFDCGVMISASHNPFYDNGIKLLNGNGEKMEDAVIDAVEAYLDSDPNSIPFATGEHIGRTVDYVSGRNRYIGYLISLARFSFKKYRIGLDCANGASFSIAPAVFNALGAKTYCINCDPDGTNINRDAGSTHIEALQALVTEKNLDIGFAFDGDADRCLCVDKNGDVITGDHILYLLANALKKENRLDGNTVVTTVMSNLGLYKALEKAGISYAQTPVGDRFVWQEMAEKGYSLGGEQSGHIILSRYATTGDGILTALQVMEAIIESKEDLSTLLKPLTIYPQRLVNVKVADKAAAMADPAVQKALKEAEEALAGNGRVLLRPSGTEPCIRVMAEAQTEAECQKWTEHIAKQLTIEN